MEKIRVLMVDDEARFRETTGKLLEKRGFITTMAQSGEKAVEIVKSRPQDVVVLDIKMEGIDGHETLKRLKKIDSELKIIMLTGHGSPDSAEKALTDNAFDYLNKPCDIDILSMKIKEAYFQRYNLKTRSEKRAFEIMTRMENYSVVSLKASLKEAMEILINSFKPSISGSKLIESGHRSILVLDDKKEPVGLLSIWDLLSAIRPAYLSAPKPSTADSVQFSSMFWEGLFTTQTKAISQNKVEELMSETPPSIEGSSNLMEVADLIYTSKRRRLLVTDNGKAVGIIREQDIFFEMMNVIL